MICPSTSCYLTENQCKKVFEVMAGFVVKGSVLKPQLTIRRLTHGPVRDCFLKNKNHCFCAFASKLNTGSDHQAKG